MLNRIEGVNIFTFFRGFSRRNLVTIECALDRLLRSFNYFLHTKSMSRKGARVFAFTLAEVLITLGIIGVVAALSIPILMQNIQDRQFKEAAKVAYSKASQAVQEMKQDNGGDLTYYTNSYRTFKPIFIQYFKVTQDCNWSDCIPSTDGTSTFSNIYKTLSNNNAGTWFMSYGQFITTDGMFYGIRNTGSSSIVITVDVNGYVKTPNIYGKDVFMFEVINDNLLPEGVSSTWFPAANFCKLSVSSVYQGLGCMQYVIQGKDY